MTSNLPKRIGGILDRLGTTGAFHTVVSREDTVNGKPHPEPYLTAASRLGVAPQRMLVFEDSANGIRAATGAGCVCVAVAQSTMDGGVAAAIPDFTVVGIASGSDGAPVLTGLPNGRLIRLEVTPRGTG